MKICNKCKTKKEFSEFHRDNANHDKTRNDCKKCRNKEKFKRLHVDHDHKTGKVRALLCSSCNTGL